MTRNTLLFPLTILAMLGTASAMRADVKVTKKAPEAVRKTFDPANLPDPPPPLEPGEDAVTVCDFSCEPNFKLDGKPHENRGENGCEVTITVEVESVDIDLTITTWLPNGAPKKLVEHEDGHSDICKRVYEKAETAATNAAKAFGKKKFTAPGKDCDEAMRAAQEKAAKAFCDAYGEKSHAVAVRVGKIYDDITKHGTNDKTAAKGVKEAFEKDDKEQDEKEKKRGKDEKEKKEKKE